MKDAGFWRRMRSGFVELCGLLIEMTYALGRGARRLWAWLRPHLARGWVRIRPHLLAARDWLVPRVKSRARAAGRWSRATGTRVARSGRRPLLLGLRVALMAAVLGALALGVTRTFLRRTPVDRIAVRQVEWGGTGVVEKDHGPGLHPQVAGRDVWHLLPAGTHLVSFANDAEGGTHPVLEVATREGESCQVSVVVPYRIREGHGWRLVADGLRADYETRAVAICRRVLLEELGALSATDHADTDARAVVEASALARLEDELGRTHLTPLDVRIGSVYFSPTYEKKMLEKLLAEQSILTQESIARRKSEQRENARVERELQRAEADLIQEYALRQEALRDAHVEAVREQETEAERHEAEVASQSEIETLRLRNEGELALAAAKDLHERLFAEHLESAGGRLHVAREAAENLRFGKVTLNSNDPRVPSVLDLDELVGLLVGGD